VITSNYGKYNTINYDTIFSKNVKIDYVDNIITGDYLDFLHDEEFTYCFTKCSLQKP
jgi:hypothetical protein